MKVQLDFCSDLVAVLIVGLLRIGFIRPQVGCGSGGRRFLARIEESIVIMAKPERIWPFLFWDRIPEWLDGIRKARYTSEEKDSVGATAHVIAEMAGIKAEWDVEITEYVRNERATWRTTGGNLTAVGLTMLESVEAGSKLTFVIDYDLPYSILGKVVDKLMVSRDVEKGIKTGLRKLKRIVEE